MAKRKTKVEKTEQAKTDANKAYKKSLTELGATVCKVLPKDAQKACKEVFKGAKEELSKQDD